MGYMLHRSHIIETHKFSGVFIAKGLEDCLVTQNLVYGGYLFGEKIFTALFRGEYYEFRVWNPFRSKLSAAIILGLDNIFMTKNSKILYVGASAGTTLSHCSDIVGVKGAIYAVEFSSRFGYNLLSLCRTRSNIVPIIEDARFPQRYQVFIDYVDCIVMDISQYDQSRILGLNAQYFLKNIGSFIVALKASSIDSCSVSEAIFAKEIKKLRNMGLKPREQLTLEPYDRNHAIITGIFRTVI